MKAQSRLRERCYRSSVPSLVLARIAGFVWLALAFGLLLLMLLLAALATPTFLIFATMGLAALIAAALLLVRPARRGLFIASATMSLVFTEVASRHTWAGRKDRCRG